MEECLLAYRVLCFNWHVNLSNKDAFTHMVDTCQSRTRWGRNRLCRGTCHESRGSPVGGGGASNMVTGFSSRGTWGESTTMEMFPSPAQLCIAAQAPPSFPLLQVIESWAGPGNEVNRIYVRFFFTHTYSLSEHFMTYCVLVKALFCREVHEVLAHTQVPLAHNGSAVAHCLQCLRDCGFIQRETCTSGERQRVNSI